MRGIRPHEENPHGADVVVRAAKGVENSSKETLMSTTETQTAEQEATLKGTPTSATETQAAEQEATFPKVKSGVKAGATTSVALATSNVSIFSGLSACKNNSQSARGF
jgi:hypothetical protein